MRPAQVQAQKMPLWAGIAFATIPVIFIVAFGINALREAREGMKIDGKWHITNVWREAPSPGADIESISGPYAVGPKGKILRLDGDRWVPQPSGVTADLHAVAYRDGQVYAVGAHGTVLHPVTALHESWLVEPSGTTEDLSAVQILGSGPFMTVVAVGEAGVVLHRSGLPSVWREAARPTLDALHGIATTESPTVAFGLNGTTVFSEDGETWKRSALPTRAPVIAVVKVDPAFLAVAADGTVWTSTALSALWTPAPGTPPKGAVVAAAPFRAYRENRWGKHQTDHESEDGIVVVVNGEPWFYGGKSHWTELPHPAEPIARLFNLDSDVLALTRSGRAFKLAR